MKSNNLVDLISKKLFRIEDWKTRTIMDSDSGNFLCPNKDKCNVVVGLKSNKKTDPILAPIFDFDVQGCDIMLIAEAPSSHRGNGLIFPGSMDKIFKSDKFDKTPLFNLLNFFKENFPDKKLYFTDIAKCGVASQSENKVLNRRVEICAEYMLLEEIRLLKPEGIYCIGNTSYEHLKKKLEPQLNDMEYSFSKNIKKLLHFGRQANLPLSDEDKAKIIWKIQCGLIKLEDDPNILKKLSFVREYLNE